MFSCETHDKIHKRVHRRRASSAVAAVLALLSLSTTGAVLAADGTDKAADWPRYHRTDNGWRYSPLASINKNNVKHMKVAWINYGGEVAGGRQETPIVIDGVAYVISAYNQVQAIDATTGREIWKYKPKLDSLVNEILATPYSRGVSVANGRVYLGTLDGRGIALDQKTGAEVWSTQLTAFRDCHGCNFTSPPVVAGDVLTFGAVAGDLFARGKIYGVDASTGKLLWTFDTIKDDPKSWHQRRRTASRAGQGAGHARCA